jgi:hypothetical protein
MADQDFNDAGGLPDLDLGYDEPGTPEEGAAQDPNYDAAVENLRQALGIPHIERIREDMMAAQADQLSTDFPELREQENAEQLVEATNEVAQRLGVSADDPRYFEVARLVHAGLTNPRAQGRVEIETGQQFLEHISGRDQGKGAGVLPF